MSNMCEVVEPENLPLDSILIAPEFDECELLCKDAAGNRKPLNRHQLAQLRRRAEFDVESANFLDIFFGWPCVNHGNIDVKLMEERLRYITCELSVKSNRRKRVMDFWDAYEQLTCLPQDSAALDPNDAKHPPYRFITPSRVPVDLRLHNSALLDRCLSVIAELRQAARGGWFQDFKENAISRYRDEGKSLSEIKRLVRQEGMREYASRLFESMRCDPTLRTTSSGIAEPLIQQASFSLILVEAKEAFACAWLAYREKTDEELQAAHPILYNICEWRERQMDKLEQSYLEVHKFDVHEFVLARCNESGLDQHAFLIGRDLNFVRDREKLLRDQLEKSASFPDTQFLFHVPAQLLRHWHVYRKTVGYNTRYELVDTVLLSRQPTNTFTSDAEEPHSPTVRQSNRHTPRSPMRGSDPVYGMANSRRPPRTDQELGPQDFDVYTASPERQFTQPGSPYIDSTGHDGACEPLMMHDAEGGVRKVHCAPPEYVVQSSLVYKASTRYFMWRWLAFFVCTYTWFLRLGQLFFITIPFRSAFSLTALVRVTPIYLKIELDPYTGRLFYNETFYQDTLISRIRRNWLGIHTARQKFDTSPSNGMLDKAAARPLHWIWSYLFRGFLGSLVMLIIWPPLCIAVSLISIILGLSLPVTVPFFSLLSHLLGLLLWDAYKPASKPNRLCPILELVHHLLIRFVLQLILASLAAFVFYPLWTLIRFIWSFVRCFSRQVWDFFVFHFILRGLARVPAREDCMVKRVAGPGTAVNHFYRARPVDVLVILLSQLELLELQLWRRQMEILADQPMDIYQRLVHSLSWLALKPQADGEAFATLQRNTQQWRIEVHSKADGRLDALQIHLNPSQLERIKLSDRDLHHTVRMGAELTDCFVQTRILPRLQLLQHDWSSWWSAFALNVDDSLGLCTHLLNLTFGEQIFTCIHETDKIFPLRVCDSSLTRHFQDFMIGMVSRRPSIRSLDAVDRLSKHMDQKNMLHGSNATGVNHDDELLSLTSDMVASSSDKISQRCTVIPAAALQQHRLDAVDSTPIPTDMDDSHSVLLSSAAAVVVDRPISETRSPLAHPGGPAQVTFAFPRGTVYRGTLRRAVPDPIALIHIDLPVFPLSAFAPSSSRHLPLALDDREHCPLDFGHSAVQRAVQWVTTPQSDFDLLQRIRHPAGDVHRKSRTNYYPFKRASLPYSNQFGMSVGSELGKDGQPLLGSNPVQLTHLRVASSTHVGHMDPSIGFGSLVTTASDPCSVAMTKSHPLLCISDSAEQCEQSVDSVEGTVISNTVNTSPPSEVESTLAWRRTGEEAATVNGYWSGVDTLGTDLREPNSRSQGTPTGSLYATEDAATTEDLDDTDDEDAVSLLSLNDNEFVDQLLFDSNPSGDGASQPIGVTVDRGMLAMSDLTKLTKLPLAVPEVLTASVTTDGSGDVEVLPMEEIPPTPDSSFPPTNSAPTVDSPTKCCIVEPDSSTGPITPPPLPHTAGLHVIVDPQLLADAIHAKQSIELKPKQLLDEIHTSIPTSNGSAVSMLLNEGVDDDEEDEEDM